jgi:hypothetical protein
MRKVFLISLFFMVISSVFSGIDSLSSFVIDNVLKGDTEGKRVFVLEQRVLQGDLITSWRDSQKAPLDGWFFFIDLFPTANWEHPSIWVFTDGVKIVKSIILLHLIF